MLLIVPGVILIGLAAGFAFASGKIRRIRRFFAAASGTHLVERLSDLRADSGTVQITGRLRPGPSGPLTSPYGEVSCVWHRQVVAHPTVEGGAERDAGKGEVVDDRHSTEPFVVADDTGQVLVDPRGSEPFGAVEVVDRWEPGPRRRYREWALLSDTPVTVRGTVSDRDGELVLGRPADDSVFVIAAESREGVLKLIDQAYRHRRPLCLAAALAGAIMIAAGLLLG